MSKREYTDEQREEALKLYKEYGAGETARRTKIPVPTITTWAKRAGIQTDAPQQMKAAIETQRMQNEQKRQQLVVKLYEKADRLLDRIEEKQVDYRGQLATRVEFDETEPASAEKLAKAAAVLLEKGELLSGQATSRTEQTGKDEFEMYLRFWADKMEAETDAP